LALPALNINKAKSTQLLLANAFLDLFSIISPSVYQLLHEAVMKYSRLMQLIAVCQLN
jgi:hypothetical protein